MAYQIVGKRAPRRGAPRVQVIWDKRRGPGQGATVRLFVGPQAYDRRVGPGDYLTMIEASQALGTYTLHLYRLVWSRRILAKKLRGVQVVPLAEIKRVMSGR